MPDAEFDVVAWVQKLRRRQAVAFVLIVVACVVVFHLRAVDTEKNAERATAVAAADAKRATVIAEGACDVSFRDWNAWQAVIETTRNPPSLRGRPITPAIRQGLAAYAKELRKDVGAKPTCTPTPK